MGRTARERHARRAAQARGELLATLWPRLGPRLTCGLPTHAASCAPAGCAAGSTMLLACAATVARGCGAAGGTGTAPATTVTVELAMSCMAPALMRP